MPEGRVVPTNSLWTCPSCGRRFRRANQSHACGLGRRALLLADKPPALVKLYLALERDMANWGPNEIFVRERYALFRTTRGFADLVFMRDGLRLALYLGRRVAAPCFFKVGRASAHRFIHVAMLQTSRDWRAVRPHLKEAYVFARDDQPSRPKPKVTAREKRQHRGAAA
jgi:Domain of unknown function (DUF5655)